MARGRLAVMEAGIDAVIVKQCIDSVPGPGYGLAGDIQCCFGDFGCAVGLDNVSVILANDGNALLAEVGCAKKASGCIVRI